MRRWHFLTTDYKLQFFVLLLLLLDNGLCVYVHHKTIGQQDAQAGMCIYGCVCDFARGKLKISYLHSQTVVVVVFCSLCERLKRHEKEARKYFICLLFLLYNFVCNSALF